LTIQDQTTTKDYSDVAEPATTRPQTGYVGSDTCEACHTQGDSLKGTPHAMATNPRTPAATHGCESCHGPGEAHVNDDDKGHIRKFTKISPAEINQTCLTCHNRGEHAGWEGSVVVEKCRNLPQGEGFDAATETYTDMVKAGIVDPVKVTRSALQNAASIAGMVLSTETLIVDKPEKKSAAAAPHHDDHMDY